MDGIHYHELGVKLLAKEIKKSLYSSANKNTKELQAIHNFIENKSTPDNLPNILTAYGSQPRTHSPQLENHSSQPKAHMSPPKAKNQQQQNQQKQQPQRNHNKNIRNCSTNNNVIHPKPQLRRVSGESRESLENV